MQSSAKAQFLPNRPSLFDPGYLGEIFGEQISEKIEQSSKEKPTLIMLYHPDCGYSKKSARIWNELSLWVKNEQL